MPKTPEDLYRRIVDINREACHHRGLSSNYGYNAILDVDLVACCLDLHRAFAPPIRILDIGCGDGLALKQLAEALQDAGIDRDDFEFWGMGLNRYEEMEIPMSRFVESGLIACRSLGRQFHLVVSVFTLHYMWHKLEAVEKIYNELLAEGGLAYLHFPGFLVRFGESPSALDQDEPTGNEVFTSFLDERIRHEAVGPMEYRLIPYYSDDEDRTLLAEFGNLRFTKDRQEPIAFGHRLKGFALFVHGFEFARMNDSLLTYVASHYFPLTEEHGPPPHFYHLEDAPPYRISSLVHLTGDRNFQADVAIHPHDSDTVVLLCPGACESLEGGVVEYRVLAERIIRLELGAVVRYGNTCDPAGPWADLLLDSFRRMIELVLESAASICHTSTPRVRILAYSACAGAAAALAADYDEVDSLLLIAPSYDVPRQTVLPNLRRFKGDVRVMIGDSDMVVLPRQAFWYYEQAENAASREYVEVPCCGHGFEGPHNKAIFYDAPLWAFGRERPRGFPPACTYASEPMY